MVASLERKLVPVELIRRRHDVIGTHELPVTAGPARSFPSGGRRNAQVGDAESDRVSEVRPSVHGVSLQKQGRFG